MPMFKSTLRNYGIVIVTAAITTSGVAWSQTNGASKAGPPDTREADARAIQAVDEATKRAAKAKDAAAVVDTWYADDGSAFYPNMPICTGKEALRKQWAAMLSTPGFAVDWQITKLEVSRSGDLAYTPFTYQMTLQGPDGKPVHDRGKGLAVWKKQPDGTWKGLADMFNSDLPLPSVAAHR
jgi:ketosteroid isomerase-like protein